MDKTKKKEEDMVAVRCSDELLSNFLSAQGTISDGTDDSTKNLTPSCSQKFKMETLTLNEKTEVHTDEEMDKRNELLLGYVFNNELIAEKMVNYLALGDMKALSEVSKSFHQVVRNTKQFKDKAKLLICEEAVGPKSHIFQSPYPWKLIDIDLSIPLHKILKSIPNILQSVHTIHLRLSKLNEVKEDNLNKLFMTILTNVPNLKNLEIEFEILFFRLFVLSNAQVIEALCQLNSFGLYKRTKDTSYRRFAAQDSFHKNFLHLSLISLIPGMQLESFKIPKTCIWPGSEGYMRNIVAANYLTLKELSLHLLMWKLNEMKIIRCPLLTSLTLTALDLRECAENIVAFLNNHPLLEELVLHTRGYFFLNVLSTIKEKCAKKLKKLHIKAKDFLGERPNKKAPVDWTFLSKMEHLEDFSVVRPFCGFCVFKLDERFGTGSTFLSVLPAKTLKKMEVKGLDSLWYLQNGGGQRIPDPQWIQITNRFQNVNELRLGSSGYSLNGKIMQNIIREFRQLNLLETSHCARLTDYGITGMNREGKLTGVSLKDLKSLIHLKIRSCRFITPEGVLNAVSLPCLRSFEFLTKHKVSKEFLLKIAEGNPSLESLSVFLSESDDVEEIKKELKTVNRRLLTLINLNEKFCAFGEDSDTDADSSPEDDDDTFRPDAGPRTAVSDSDTDTE